MSDVYRMQNDYGEVTLAKNDKNFNGSCYLHEKKGHKKGKCPEKTRKISDNKKMLKGYCSTHGKKGHEDADCWTKEENDSKRMNTEEKE